MFFDYATDNCDYYNGPSGTILLGNWATEWCAANPSSDLCWTCSCAHSEALNCNLKGRAFWWMMARLAGWEGPLGIQPTQSLNDKLKCWFSNENIYISPYLPEESVISIQLFDGMGKMRVETTVNYFQGNELIVIPATFLQNGCYLIRLSMNHQHLLTGKCIVNR